MYTVKCSMKFEKYKKLWDPWNLDVVRRIKPTYEAINLKINYWETSLYVSLEGHLGHKSGQSIFTRNIETFSTENQLHKLIPIF